MVSLQITTSLIAIEVWLQLRFDWNWDCMGTVVNWDCMGTVVNWDCMGTVVSNVCFFNDFLFRNYDF